MMDNNLANKTLVILTILMLLAVSSFGIIKSIGKSRQVVESYYSEISLNESIVLDDQNTLNKFGSPITLEKGTRGEISDSFDWYSECHGYKHIKARLIWMIIKDWMLFFYLNQATKKQLIIRKLLMRLLQLVTAKNSK